MRSVPKSKRETNTYSPQFRESSVKLALDPDKPVSDTAKEIVVNASTLPTWIGKYSRPSVDGSGRTGDHLYEELKRLKKENSRLKEERDILKKAAAYFAKGTR